VEVVLESVHGANISPDERVDKIYRISEALELEIAFKCLKTPVLEKKLVGHQILI
jgi:hypothetical protein